MADPTIEDPTTKTVSRPRPDVPARTGRGKDAPRRHARRSATRGEPRDSVLAAATDEAVDVMASWGFVWVRDPCGCDGSGNAWIKDATLDAGGRFKRCVCLGQGRVWYPQGRKTPARVTDRQLVELFAKERTRRARG